MITSYGPNSGDESESDIEENSTKKKVDNKTQPAQKKKIVTVENNNKRKTMKKNKVDKEKPVVMGPELPKRMELDESSNCEMGPQLPSDYLLKVETNSNSPNSPALASLVAYGADDGNDDGIDDNDDNNSNITSPKPSNKFSLLSSSVADDGPPGVESSIPKSSTTFSSEALVKPKIKDQIKDKDNISNINNNNKSPKTENHKEEMLIIERETDAKSTLALQKLRKLKQKAENNTDESSSSDSSSDSDNDEHKNVNENDNEGDDDDDEEIDENVIISRLRSQANILKELGGEIPDSIKELIAEDRPTSFSLIAGNRFNILYLVTLIYKILFALIIFAA